MLKTEILTPPQLQMLDLVSQFGKDYYLVGGTALALQLGHRRSIDFDLFTGNSFDNDRIIAKVQQYFPVQQVYINQTDQLTLISNGVQMTWYKYEYPVQTDVSWEGIINLPNILSIAAMKAYALGRRAKWKDYVDLYFVLQQYSLKQIAQKAVKIVGDNMFDEILLREQLAYFDDINYQEKVEYMSGFEVNDEVIKQKLIEIATTE